MNVHPPIIWYNPSMPESAQIPLISPSSTTPQAGLIFSATASPKIVRTVWRGSLKLNEGLILCISRTAPRIRRRAHPVQNKTTSAASWVPSSKVNPRSVNSLDFGSALEVYLAVDYVLASTDI